MGPALLDGIIIDVDLGGAVKEAATGRIIPCTQIHTSASLYLHVILSVVGQGRDLDLSFSFDTQLLRQIQAAATFCHTLTQQQILGNSFGEADMTRFKRVLSLNGNVKVVSDVLEAVLLPTDSIRHIRGCHFVCQKSLNPYSQVLDGDNRLPVSLSHPPMAMCGRVRPGSPRRYAHLWLTLIFGMQCQSVTYCSPGRLGQLASALSDALSLC